MVLVPSRWEHFFVLVVRFLHLDLPRRILLQNVLSVHSVGELLPYLHVPPDSFVLFDHQRDALLLIPSIPVPGLVVQPGEYRGGLQ